MRVTPLFFLGLAAASPALVTRAEGWPDLTGSYWDLTVAYQSGRPGYSIKDLSVTFHNSKSEETAEAKCHYSFVPQGTRPPSEVTQCSSGLEYTWDYTTLSLRQNIVLGNRTIQVFGEGEIKAERRSDGAGGSSAKGSGKIEINHYCTDRGCAPPNGCVGLEC
ncbi:hypothetical protein yc1106_08559 [Curvularia clavata]|uniref:AA1-like domain-containing protein n=1 Tax=Curvularia clavata TaxID=95742 RepID=A0A9Q8ZFI6_CURCL|nr:hypothetical protein yc1106_08559 [Curvularia clavata]